MKKVLMTLLAVLVPAIPALAEELYWDDDIGSDAGYLTPIYRPAVLFHDAAGEGQPGDTGGLDGVITQLRVFYELYDEDDAVDIYIYSRDGDNPGESLAGPLDYSVNRQDWVYYNFDEQVELPGEFFIVVIGDGFNLSRIQVDGTDGYDDWDYYHSRVWQSSHWDTVQWDLRMRIEWEPGYADYDPPYVDDMDPDDGEADVPEDSLIVFHCKDDSRGVDASTIDFNVQDDSLSGSGWAMSVGAACRIAYEPTRNIYGNLDIDETDPNDILCTFTPYQYLPIGRITCTVDGSLADKAGNEMGDDFVWSFTTEGYQSAKQSTWGQIKSSF